MAAEITVPPPPRPVLVSLTPEQQRINTLTSIMNRGQNMFDQHRKCEADARADITRRWESQGRTVHPQMDSHEARYFEQLVEGQCKVLAKRRGLPKFDRAVINDGLAAKRELENL